MQVVVVVKRTIKEIQPSELFPMGLREVFDKPVSIHYCKGWAQAWVAKQPKEKMVEYIYENAEFQPDIEDD